MTGGRDPIGSGRVAITAGSNSYAHDNSGVPKYDGSSGGEPLAGGISEGEEQRRGVPGGKGGIDS